MALRRSVGYAYCATGPATTSALGSSTRFAPIGNIGRRNTPTGDRREFSSTASRRLPRQAHVDHYKSLKLHKNATKQQIKAKFYELSKELHPDAKGGSAEAFHAINEAYGILGDAVKRREYDLANTPPEYHSNQNYTHPSAHQDWSRRTSGPHAGWSTRRPPPTRQTPTPGNMQYAAFGRHTPKGYSASSGSYGDPMQAARDQVRGEFEGVRRTGSYAAGAWHRSQSGYGGTPHGGGHVRSRPGRGVEGGSTGQVVMVFILVGIVAILGMSSARADTGDTDEASDEGEEDEGVAAHGRGRGGGDTQR